MSKISQRIVWSAGLGVLFVIANNGCSPAQEAAVRLDRVAASVDEYGFASISSPFLAMPTTEFEFDLNRKAADYYSDAFTPQGGVRNESAVALDVQLAFKMNIEQAFATIAQFNRAKSISSIREAKRKAKFQKKMLETLVAGNPETGENAMVKAVTGMLDVVAEQDEPSEEVLPGFEPSDKEPEAGSPIPKEDRLALGAVGGFTSGLGFPADEFKISARDALLIASGDRMTQSLFRWFTNPAGNKLNEYELFFCPVIVSVQPGYKTREGFLADITVNVDLAHQSDDGKLHFLSESYPHSSPPLQVAGVFPVVDSQVLNVANSRRQLYSFALQLSLMGFGSQADAFVDHAKRLEQDAQTQSAITVGSAYTIGSTAFGFRVEPKFIASKDPTRIETRPGRILDSKTLPAMAVLLVHRDFLQPAHDPWDEAPECGKKKAKPEKCDVEVADGSPRSALKGCGCAHREKKFDHLAFRTSTRWAPVNTRLWGPTRFSEVEAWERSRDLDFAEKWINGHSNLNGSIDCYRDLLGWGFDHVPSKHQVDQLSLRTINLRKLAMDTQALMRIGHAGPKSRVYVESVTPQRGWRDQYTVLTLRGSGFRGNVRYVTVGGITCESIVSDDHTLLVVVPPWDADKTELAKRTQGIEGLATKVVVSRVQRDAASTNGLAPDASSPATREQAWLAKKGLMEHLEAVDKMLPENITTMPSDLQPLEEKAEAVIADAKALEPDFSDKARSLLEDVISKKKDLRSKPLEFKNALTQLVNTVKEEFEPLTPSEQRQLKVLEAKAASSTLTEDEATRYNALSDREARAILYALKQKEASEQSTRLAEIVLASRVPVERRCSNDSFPAEPPKEALVPPCGSLPVGWVVFDKSLKTDNSPKPKPSEAGVVIKRDPAGNIIGVEVQGDVEKSQKLLDAIKNALLQSGPLSFQFKANGGVDVGASSHPDPAPEKK